MTPSVVLSRPSPCNVPQGYASVAELPAALPGCHFEHPAGNPALWKVEAQVEVAVTPCMIASYSGCVNRCMPSLNRRVSSAWSAICNTLSSNA